MCLKLDYILYFVHWNTFTYAQTNIHVCLVLWSYKYCEASNHIFCLLAKENCQEDRHTNK